MSMQMGADDYVQKPNFDAERKVQALLRRTYEYLHKEIGVFKFRDAVFDFKN